MVYDSRMSKLEREVEALVDKMEAHAAEIEEFNKRKSTILSPRAAWRLLQGSLKLLSAASKTQLLAVRETSRATRKSLDASVSR